MIHLNEGESIEVQGSGKKPYVVKNSGGVVNCSCPAWKNQSLPIDQRICKHIKANVSNGAAASVHQSGSVVNGTAPKTPTKPKNVPPCLLAHTWDRDVDVSGWWSSYKLDGVRAWWDGERFWSRLGNEYFAPQWFKDKMPKGVVLDGELFAGNGRFQKTVSYVRKGTPVDAEWEEIQFMVFDMPNHPGPFEDRLDAMVKLLRDEFMGYYVPRKGALVNLLDQSPVKDNKRALEWDLALATKYGYEGSCSGSQGASMKLVVPIPSSRSRTFLTVR